MVPTPIPRPVASCSKRDRQERVSAVFATSQHACGPQNAPAYATIVFRAIYRSGEGVNSWFATQEKRQLQYYPCGTCQLQALRQSSHPSFGVSLAAPSLRSRSQSSLFTIMQSSTQSSVGSY